MTNIRYCYREPDFPKESYLALVFVSSGDDLKFLYPMMPLYPSLNVLKIEIENFKKKLGKKKEMVVYGVIAIKITLARKFPLRKEHWANPQGELFEKDYRITKFRDMMTDMPQLYLVLVLPNHYDTKIKKWSFINWIPLLITANDGKIDNLIKMSDQPVDESSKNIGIYSIEYAKGFDLVTGKIIEPESKTPLKESNC